MTKLLSFAEWVENQEADFNFCDAPLCQPHSPNCATIAFWKDCKLLKAYEQQKAQDLKKWEKWNRIGDESTGRLPSEEVL